MADKRITELNLHNSLIFSDVIPIVNSGETKKTTYGTLYYGIRDGVVSGSSQITISDTTGFTEFSSSLSASIALGTNEQDLSNYALISGGNEFIGDQIISGSFTSSLTEGHFFVGNGDNKTQEFPTSSFVQTTQTGSLVQSAHISLYSTASQQLVESGSAQPVTFTSVWTQNGVSLVSGSQIVMEKAGTYQFNFVAQVQNTQNASHDSYFWIKYNGNNFPNSSTQMSLQARKNETTPSSQLMTVNIVGVAQNDNDYIELYWTGDSDTIRLNETPSDGVKPETPSVIANIIRVG